MTEGWLGNLETLLGFRTTHSALYQQAFVHKSYASNTFKSNERLEFIGDAVINLIVTRWLYESWPAEQEGFLTKLRTRLVSGKCLSRLAQHLQLHRFVMMNERGLRNGFQHNARIQEDVLEALVGAIYLSEGLIVARQFLISLYQKCININELFNEDNFKDTLMRWTQANGLPLPEYIIVTVHAPREDSMTQKQKPLFEISVTINGLMGVGFGCTKKIAQQEAAQKMLALLHVPADY